ncbi:MAG: maleylpyruvate isomerase family mycothiol-dependent enzyme [Frankiaceae bacterium]|nr:maleylpyruvate isomerase family mycothiol-dependent enzyme [Frankiaceae bacterium]
MKFAPTPEEIADIYAGAYQRVTALATDFDEADLAVVVPGTPRWTLHGLMSHLVGGPVDFANGRVEGAGGEPWTQQQVDDRVDRSLDELLEEWAGVLPGVDAAVRSGNVPAPVSFDILTHESDIRGALGLDPTPDAAGVRFLTDGFGARAVAVARKAELPPLRLCASDTGWSAGVDGGVTATATEHEWTRALTGRRSNAQVSAYDWTGDPSPYLPLLSPFGPLRDADVRE